MITFENAYYDEEQEYYVIDEVETIGGHTQRTTVAYVLVDRVMYTHGFYKTLDEVNVLVEEAMHLLKEKSYFYQIVDFIDMHPCLADHIKLDVLKRTADWMTHQSSRHNSDYLKNQLAYLKRCV